MWTPDPSKLVKIAIHSQGEDVETPFAEDLGPADGPPGSRRVRIGNVLFLHAKPTYEDVVIASPDEDGRLTWDTQGMQYDAVCERLDEDSGRWTMIVEYEVEAGSDVVTAFKALDLAGMDADIAVEGLSSPKPGKPGRAYLAMPGALRVDAARAFLRGLDVPMTFEVVHPVDDKEPAATDSV